jgi:hypothetical protein
MWSLILTRKMKPSSRQIREAGSLVGISDHLTQRCSIESNDIIYIGRELCALVSEKVRDEAANLPEIVDNACKHATIPNALEAEYSVDHVQTLCDLSTSWNEIASELITLNQASTYINLTDRRT